MGDRLFTWLHISDIHFGHGDAEHRFDQESVTEALIRDAARLQQAGLGPPDAVLVTGDIAFSAKSSQYGQAASWLTRLLTAVGASAEQVLVVPGNHDVDRAKASTEPALGAHQALRAAPGTLNEYLSSEKRMRDIWPKLSAFAAFARRFGTPPLTARAPFWTRAELKQSARPVVAVGLNTALLSYDSRDAPENLALGAGQIVKAIERQPEDALLVVLMHHPPTWLRDGERLLAVLQQRPHLLFSGHVHAQHASLGLNLTAGMVLHFAAGAAHAEARDAGAHAYAWGQLSTDGLIYHPRMYLAGARDYAAQPVGASAQFKQGETLVLPKERLPQNLSRWISGAAGGAAGSGASLRPVVNRGPLPLGPNPFQKSGTLPADKRSYIRRACDSELEEALGAHSRIVICGESELGKSSLRARMTEWLRQRNQQVCYVDIQDLDFYNPGSMTQEFLARVSRVLNQDGITSWGTLKSTLGTQDMTLVIDEFGRLLSGSLTNLAMFIGGLTHFVTTHNDNQGQVRVVVCLPVLIEQFFSAVRDLPEKYTRGWKHVHVQPFLEREADQLLELLPPRALLATRQNRQAVLTNSRLRPRALQCLAFELYARCSSAECSDAELAAIVRSIESYK